MRSAHTLFKWVKGHNGHAGNEEADVLAGIGAAKTSCDDLNLTIPRRYRLTGAKLQALTQKLAYRAIRNRADTQTKPRPRAAANIDRISSGVEDAFRARVHESTIWNSLRAKHVTRPISQFMWMAVHDGYMLGTHWLRPRMSEELQQRAMCATCGECETMSHILFECGANGQESVWSLLEELWRLTEASWKPPNWGTTFGAACAIFKTAEGARRTATEQLWCILSTEALHLVWKLRCERVIQNEGRQFSEQEIANRFFATMNSKTGS